jgi:hypothetical protein
MRLKKDIFLNQLSLDSFNMKLERKMGLITSQIIFYDQFKLRLFRGRLRKGADP